MKSIKLLTYFESDHEMYEFLTAHCNTPCGTELQTLLALYVILVGREKCHGIEVERTMRVTNRAFNPPRGAYLNDRPHPPHPPWEAYGGYKAYVAFHEQWNTLTQAAMAPSIAIPPHL